MDFFMSALKRAVDGRTRRRLNRAPRMCRFRPGSGSRRIWPRPAARGGSRAGSARRASISGFHAAETWQLTKTPCVLASGCSAPRDTHDSSGGGQASVSFIMVHELPSFHLGNPLRGAARASALLRRFFGDRDGATLVVVGIAMPVLIGAMGLASEITYWHLHQRAMQNAADAAVMAAATAGGSDYAAAVKAVASQYGFTDGSGQIAVTTGNPASAAGCTAKCYTVTISDAVPIMLS